MTKTPVGIAGTRVGFAGFPAAFWLRTVESCSNRSTGGRFSIANPLKHFKLLNLHSSLAMGNLRLISVTVRM